MSPNVRPVLQYSPCRVRWENAEQSWTESLKWKPAGRAEADVTVQTVNQLEEDPSGREWALTKHKHSHQEF